MANALYDSGRESFLKADIDMEGGAIHLAFTDHADVTPSVSTHDFYDDIEAGEVDLSGAFSNKTFTDGVFDAEDVTVSAVTGDPFESINIHIVRGGASSADDLIAHIDTATGLPTTPNGGDITVAWDSGANKIFKL